MVTDDSDDNISSDSDGVDDAYKKDEIVAISKAFEDIPRDGNAPWAVAVLLASSQHHTEARKHAREAVARLTGRPKQVQALDLLANICCELHENKKRAIDIDEARERTSEALSSTVNAEPKLHRKVLLTAARVHKAIGDSEQAATYYRQARNMLPDEPMLGDHLFAESQMYFASKRGAELVTLVGQWQSTEKLTWMTWHFDEGTGVHQNFTRAAGRTRQQDIMVGVYNEVISLLDSLDSAAPIRYFLARAQWLICGDIKAAVALMSETLDATSNNELHKFTNEEPTWSLVCAAVLMAQLIYEQYRATSSRALKAQLFDEINGLLRRPLAQSVTLARSDLLYVDLVNAKMTRKMGTAMQFQDKLQKAFDTCFEALIDNVGWNDWLNLINMAVIISQLEGMERDAQILVSAQFSQLQPELDKKADEGTRGEGASDANAGTKQNDDDENAGDTDAESSEDDSSVSSEAPDEEGDLTEVQTYCDGDCEPTMEWECWKGRKMYICMTCDALSLCAECYEKRQAYNTGQKECPVSGPYFCGKDHKYIEGPVSGWGGIRNGIMTIDGVEVEWRMWLEELRNDRWMKAWDRFWSADE
nr:hypothetical protein CFP56_23841 [Quercus suber]